MRCKTLIGFVFADYGVVYVLAAHKSGAIYAIGVSIRGTGQKAAVRIIERERRVFRCIALVICHLCATDAARAHYVPAAHVASHTYRGSACQILRRCMPFMARP